MASDKQYISEEYRLVRHSEQVIVERVFKQENATIVATKTLTVGLQADKNITAISVENHDLVVNYSDAPPSVHAIGMPNIYYAWKEKLSVEYANGQSPSLNCIITPTLIIRAENGKIIAKQGSQEKIISEPKSDVVGIFNISGNPLVIYSDKSSQFFYTRNISEELRAQLDFAFTQAAKQFELSIKQIPKHKNTPDGYNVQKVMTEIHARILACAEPYLSDSSNTQTKEEALNAFQTLTAMIWDKGKCNNPIAFNSKKKPVTNLVLGALCLIAATALIGGSIAGLILFWPILGVAIVGFWGAGILTWLAARQLHHARKDYTLEKNISRFRGYAKNPEAVPTDDVSLTHPLRTIN